MTYLAVHQRADLTLHRPGGHAYTKANDVAHVTRLDEKTASSHLASLARRGMLIRRTSELAVSGCRFRR